MPDLVSRVLDYWFLPPGHPGSPEKIVAILGQKPRHWLDWWEGRWRNYEQHLAMQKLESLGVLAAGVAHDFNNLLGAIVARTESAQGELVPESPVADDVRQIRVTALRAAEIVSQLMTFAGQENTASTAIDLSSVVAKILDLLKLSIAKTAVLKTELASGLSSAARRLFEIRSAGQP